MWKSNGTPEGTSLVQDVSPDAVGSYPGALTKVNGVLYFTANDGVHGTELWKSNGSADGTVLIADVNPDAAGADPAALTNVNGVLYFSANDGSTGVELWKSDGTPEGTARSRKSTRAGPRRRLTWRALTGRCSSREG